MRKSWLTASLLALTVASPFAAADIQGHKAGDFIIRGGFATVDPDDSSSDISWTAPSSAVPRRLSTATPSSA